MHLLKRREHEGEGERESQVGLTIASVVFIWVFLVLALVCLKLCFCCSKKKRRNRNRQVQQLESQPEDSGEARIEVEDQLPAYHLVTPKDRPSRPVNIVLLPAPGKDNALLHSADAMQVPLPPGYQNARGRNSI